MFYVPREIKSIAKTDVDLLFLLSTVKDIAHVKIDKVSGPHGQAVFVSGNYANVSKAINIFQCANFELTLALSQEGNTVNCEDLSNFIEEKFGRKRDVRRSFSKSPTLMKEDVIVISDDEETELNDDEQKKKKISYERAQLVDIALNMKMEFPMEHLKTFMEKDQDAGVVVLMQSDGEKRIKNILDDLHKPASWV